MKSLSSIIKSHQYVPVSIELPKTNILRTNQYKKSDQDILIQTPEPTDKEELKNLENEALDQERQEWLIEKQRLLDEAHREAENILQQAQEQADELKQRTHLEVEAWWLERRAEDERLQSEAHDEGYRLGFQQGQAQGYEEGWEQLQQTMMQAQQILEEAYLVKQNTLREAEPFLVQLSVEIAKKILREELSVHPEKSVSIVKEALTRVLEVEKLTIGVNPEHFLVIQQQKGELSKFLNGDAELVILPDFSIAEGGCLIRSPYGTIDAKLDTQLEEIKHALLELSKGRDDDGSL